MIPRNLFKFILLSFIAKKAFNYLMKRDKLPNFVKELHKSPYAKQFAVFASDFLKMAMLRRKW